MGTTSRSLDALFRRARYARQTNRLADAHRELSDAVSLCRQAGLERDLVRALKALGQIERDRGRGNAARQLYQEAAALCREQGDLLGLAHTVRHLGDVHFDAGRLELARPCYEEALQLYRAHEPAPALDFANALRSMAIFQDALENREDAIRLWEEARDLYAAVNVQEGVAESGSRIERLTRQLRGGEAP